MIPIRVRTATGVETLFATREEFSRAVGSGRIAPASEVYHARAGRWLPVTVHPAYTAAQAAAAEPAAAPKARSSDLVLIYPDFAPSREILEAAAPAAEIDPFDGGPILAPDEIQRILHAPRRGDPDTAMARDILGSTGRTSGPQMRPLLEKAMPTFSKAFNSLLS